MRVRLANSFRQFMARTSMQVSPVVVGIGLVLCAVGFSSCSRLLDQQVKARQAAAGDAAGMGLAGTDTWRTLELQSRQAEEWQRLDILHRLEWLLYDWRVQLAVNSDQTPSMVGLVYASDNSVDRVANGEAFPGTGEKYDLFWPRWPVYGRVLRELRAQGAAAVAFDVLFMDRRLSEDNLQILERKGGVDATNVVRSDDRFGQELRRPGASATVAVIPGKMPVPVVHAGAGQVGDAISPRDADSVARRVRAMTRMRWVNPEIGMFAQRNAVDCSVDDDGSVHVHRPGANETNFVLKPDEEGKVLLPVSQRFSRKVPVFQEKWVWHLGIALAGEALGLDLDNPQIMPGAVRLTGTNGVERVLPVDDRGYVLVDWRLGMAQTNLVLSEDVVDVLVASQNREFDPDPIEPKWTNRVVVFGSTASGNNLSDLGATPLTKADFLVTTHMNVADMVLRGSFIRSIGAVSEGFLVGFMGVIAAVLTWRLRGIVLPGVILAIAVVWTGICVWSFREHRVWLPVAHPVFAGLLIPYLGMVTTRAFVEQREQLRVRRFFEKMVSPDIVEEVLKTQELGKVGAGARRRLTVFFADIRGFTEMTDRYQAAAEKYVTEHGLDEAAAERYYEHQASEVLATVNLYLATIADVIKFHRGTLDKYIGDCVMAFWGAPLSNPRHALDAVLAALDAQWAIQYLNEARTAETARREAENPRRIARGEPPLPALPVLNLGSGLNTGDMTVGFMGSEAHIRNYTVFGRDVNLASRLEGASGHARILIGEATFADIRRDAPELAESFKALPPVTVKGFRQPVLVYEVPWQQARDAALRCAPLLSKSLLT
jgi:class 3 adenylate cyclase